GPGDFKPTPSADLLLSFLNWRLPFGMPWTGGGLSLADVDDIAAGHARAMEKGKVGERYILGGTNVSFGELFETIADLTGLSRPGYRASRREAMMLGSLMQLGARVTGGKPALTYKLARDYVDRYVWVSSKKAERELGYVHRPLRPTLTRAIRFL